jgi:hypothetical protein
MIAVGVRKFYASKAACPLPNAPSRRVQPHARNVVEVELQSGALPAAVKNDFSIGQRAQQVIRNVVNVERFTRHLSAVLDPARLAGRARQRAARRHSNVRGDSNELL